MLKIDDLKVSLEEEEKQIIKGLSLSIKPGEVHAIMGPNGSGKSTLSSVLAGKDGYNIDGGNVEFDGIDLLEAEVEERAAEVQKEFRSASLLLGLQIAVDEILG